MPAENVGGNAAVDVGATVVAAWTGDVMQTAAAAAAAATAVVFRIPSSWGEVHDMGAAGQERNGVVVVAEVGGDVADKAKDGHCEDGRCEDGRCEDDHCEDDHCEDGRCVEGRCMEAGCMEVLLPEKVANSLGGHSDGEDRVGGASSGVGVAGRAIAVMATS